MINPGFEASGTPGFPGYIQPAPISGWTSTGNYGVNVSGPGPFANNGINPEQDRVAFLQGDATLSQFVEELEDGEAYHLSFAFNARSGNRPTLNVSVNGETALEYEVNPVGDAEPYYVFVYNFTADSDVADIAFAQTAAGDNTVLLDDVRLLKGKGTEVELPGPEEPAVPISHGAWPRRGRLAHPELVCRRDRLGDTVRGKSDRPLAGRRRGGHRRGR